MDLAPLLESRISCDFLHRYVPPIALSLCRGIIAGGQRPQQALLHLLLLDSLLVMLTVLTLFCLTLKS